MSALLEASVPPARDVQVLQQAEPDVQVRPAEQPDAATAVGRLPVGPQGAAGERLRDAVQQVQPPGAVRRGAEVPLPGAARRALPREAVRQDAEEPLRVGGLQVHQRAVLLDALQPGVRGVDPLHDLARHLRAAVL